jgi:hypothetical protein
LAAVLVDPEVVVSLESVALSAVALSAVALSELLALSDAVKLSDVSSDSVTLLDKV